MFFVDEETSIISVAARYPMSGHHWSYSPVIKHDNGKYPTNGGFFMGKSTMNGGFFIASVCR